MSNKKNKNQKVNTPEVILDEQQPKQKSTFLNGDELTELKKQLKEEMMAEMKDENALKIEEIKKRREEEKAEQLAYVDKMKESPDPWVDIVGWIRTDEGVKVELDWNNALVDHLRANNITGADDDEVVQKWVTLLMRDMADQIDGDMPTNEFE